MEHTFLANTWIVAHLPGTKYTAVICCAGSAGEAALRNSLDGVFMEAGYQHLPATLNRKRPPTYYVVGTVAADQPIPHTDLTGQEVSTDAISEACTPTHRIIRHPHTDIKRRNQTYQHAQVFTNNLTMALTLNAVVLDLSTLNNTLNLP